MGKGTQMWRAQLAQRYTVSLSHRTAPMLGQATIFPSGSGSCTFLTGLSDSALPALPRPIVISLRNRWILLKNVSQILPHFFCSDPPTSPHLTGRKANCSAPLWLHLLLLSTAFSLPATPFPCYALPMPCVLQHQEAFPGFLCLTLCWSIAWLNPLGPHGHPRRWGLLSPPS